MANCLHRDVRQDQMFLATTALDETWETTKPILFLGPWCIRYVRRAALGNLNAQVMPDYWRGRADQVAAFDYLWSLHQKLLDPLTEVLNRCHGIHRSRRYWQILIGPWLLYYLPVLYDRYRSLKSALQSHPDIECSGVPVDAHAVPRDFAEFMEWSYDDPYNFQIYTRVLEHLGASPAYRVTVPVGSATSVPPSGVRTGLIGSAKRLALQGYRRLFARAPLVLRDSFFSRRQEFELALRLGGRMRIDKAVFGRRPRREVDISQRQALEGLVVAAGDPLFEALLTKLLPHDLPLCYVEEYGDLDEQVRQAYPSTPRAIFSANAWYFDEVFKMWAASAAAAGASLLGAQHGGNYGSVQRTLAQTYELSILDRFYTWGWRAKPDGAFAEVAPMPATKLIDYPPIGAANRQEGVLFVSTTNSRYVSMHFPESTADFCDYLEWQQRFARALAPEVRRKMRVRLLRDRGWDFALRWRDAFPEVACETFHDRDFLTSVRNCRIYVCDHLSTTFVEALASNKPSVIFWNPATNELLPEAEPIYARLREVGILHETPEAAALAVGSAYGDVEAWWGSAPIQSAVKAFCAYFALMQERAIPAWSQEFERYLP